MCPGVHFAVQSAFSGKADGAVSLCGDCRTALSFWVIEFRAGVSGRQSPAAGKLARGASLCDYRTAHRFRLHSSPVSINAESRVEHKALRAQVAPKALQQDRMWEHGESWLTKAPSTFSATNLTINTTDNQLNRESKKPFMV